MGARRGVKSCKSCWNIYLLSATCIAFKIPPPGTCLQGFEHSISKLNIKQKVETIFSTATVGSCPRGATTTSSKKQTTKTTSNKKQKAKTTSIKNHKTKNHF